MRFRERGNGLAPRFIPPAPGFSQPLPRQTACSCRLYVIHFLIHRRFLLGILTPPRVRREAACGGDLNTAVDRAVAGCIEEGILAEFLSGHRAEVLNMFLYDFDEEKYMEMERSEARAMATADALLLFLSGLGTVPAGIKHKIGDEIHPDVQTGWLKLAYSSDSVDDFIQKSGLTP